jgi:hypothetical protein
MIKKLTNKLNLLFINLILSLIINAQTPEGFNYSAVARDVTGKPLANRNVSVQLSILKTSAIGALQYAENHLVNTDGYGLFNLVVGNGTAQSGSMNNIQWGSDNHYLKVAIDANGGSNYITMGTTQIMSVPYALHAKTADNGIDRVSVSGDTLFMKNGQIFVQTVSGFTHFIGEQFGGGVIFNLWKDSVGNEHGLIVDLNNLGQVVWSNVSDTIGNIARSKWDGLNNSIAIVSQSGHTNSAAKLCLDLVRNGYSDWYLPAIDELYTLYLNHFNVNKVISSISGADIINGPSVFLADVGYWSSTELNSYQSVSYFFTWIFYYEGNKNQSKFVRAIRAF